MFDKEYRYLLLVPQPNDHFSQASSLSYIETGRGLIEKKKSGFSCECASDLENSLFPERKV